MSEAELDEVVRRGLVERGLRQPRARGGAAGGRPRGAAPVPRGAARSPDAVIPTYVEREFSFTLDGDRVRGRWDRVDIVPRRGRRARPPTAGDAGPAEPRADVVTPTLGMLGPRAGDDHRLQVVRRPRPGQGPPAGARLAPAPDLRDGLRGDDRPAARTRSRSTSSSRASSARSRSTRSGWPRRASRSPRPRPGCGRATTRRLPRPARAPRTARRASARHAAPFRDRASARLDAPRAIVRDSGSPA